MSCIQDCGFPPLVGQRGWPAADAVPLCDSVVHGCAPLPRLAAAGAIGHDFDCIKAQLTEAMGEVPVPNPPLKWASCCAFHGSRPRYLCP